VQTAAVPASNTPAVAASAPAASTPAPVPAVPTFDDWVQDFEEAKRRASAEGKDILVAFSGSDWSGWSVRQANEVYLQREFRQKVDGRYVLVYVDFPRSQNRSKVQNSARNQELAEHFGVTGYPTMVLADAQGHPYGMENYVEGGTTVFLDRIEGHRSVRQERDRLFARITSAEGEQKLQALKETLELLLRFELLTYYGDHLKDWTQVALALDPRNAHGVYERVFECRWMIQFSEMNEPQERQLVDLVAALDKWESQCDFQDADRGALMHLLAGVCLLQAGASPKTKIWRCG
jgi:hypothetical protein